MKTLLAIFIALIMISGLSQTTLAAEPDYGKAYGQAVKWLGDTKFFLEVRPWKVISNEWSTDSRERCTIILSTFSMVKNGRDETLTLNYEPGDEDYRWLRPGDSIKFKVPQDDNTKMELRDEIIRFDGYPKADAYYRYSYISNITLAPATPTKN